MKNQLVLAVLLATASSTAAAADGLRHTYVEAGFIRHQVKTPLQGPAEIPAADVSIEDAKADGGYIAGSYEIGERFYVFGGYQKGNADIGVSIVGLGDVLEIDTDLQQGRVGFGYHRPVSDRVEWTGELSFIHTQIKFDREYVVNPRAKGDDYRASLGLQGDLAANFEGWVKANYTDGDVYDGEFSGTLGALIKFNEVWGIVGEAEVGSDDRQFRVGVRASF
ncbi:hypothetical protein [Lysobacter sp. CA199]|uniref:hypothetical protein n=1 Tax=Lysobacter sp. CA199 TaxID=3455608 RepID=UPI003F8D84FF